MAVFAPKYLKNGHFGGQGPKYVNSEFVTVLTSQIALSFLIWVEIVNLQFLGNFKKKNQVFKLFCPKKYLKNGPSGGQKEAKIGKTCARFVPQLEKYLEFLHFLKSSEAVSFIRFKPTSKLR